MIYKAVVTVNVENEMDIQSLNNYLSKAVILDIDIESEGYVGVTSIEIDWDTLRTTLE